MGSLPKVSERETMGGTSLSIWVIFCTIVMVYYVSSAEGKRALMEEDKTEVNADYSKGLIKKKKKQKNSNKLKRKSSKKTKSGKRKNNGKIKKSKNKKKNRKERKKKRKVKKRRKIKKRKNKQDSSDEC